MSETGFHLRTPGGIITSHLNLAISERGHGLLKTTSTWIGNLQVQALLYGSMENVGIRTLIVLRKLMGTVCVAGAGKSVVWYDSPSMIFFRELIVR